MRYADQHIHCDCSFDATGELTDMARAAKAAGMSAVCFTDHMDMADETTGHARSALDERREKFLRRREKAESVPGLEIRLGMELGEPCQLPEEAARAAALPGLDFVIGSLHNLPDVPDFYFYPYASEEECESLNRRYLAELRRMAELDCFDVMGHVGYTCRYMSRKGFHTRITAAQYRDELSDIFTRLIERGKGIECNASGFRDGASPYPDADILRLYRSLGGEIITVGSDAHIPELASLRVPEVYALLRSCGFKAVCEFKQRRCEWIPLE